VMAGGALSLGTCHQVRHRCPQMLLCILKS